MVMKTGGLQADRAIAPGQSGEGKISQEMFVAPAKAGVHEPLGVTPLDPMAWIPAFAGMTTL
jgi:hypothetical protein